MDKPVPLTLAESALRRIAAHLEAEKLRVNEEIRIYPRPIAACDQQFNHALERRAGLLQDLARLYEISREVPGCGDGPALLLEFLGSSCSLDDEAKQEMATYLKKGLAELWS